MTHRMALLTKDCLWMGAVRGITCIRGKTRYLFNLVLRCPSLGQLNLRYTAVVF